MLPWNLEDRGMKVAQVNYVFDASVIDPDALLERYSTLRDWGESILAAGATRVLTFQRFGRDAAFTRNGVDYVFRRDGSGERPRFWNRSTRLHAALAQANLDVAHVNGLEFGGALRHLRHAVGPSTAIVVQDHGGQSQRLAGRATPDALVGRRGFRAADGFLFTAGAQAGPWRRAGAITSGQRVFEVPEASTHLRGIPRSAARIASHVEGTPAVLWVGRLNANKDPLTVLDGFEQSLTHLPQAVLTLVHGTDDQLSAVSARVSGSPALRDHVRLAGHVGHEMMPAYYSAADLFVLGSHHEGSGYALIEACACGTVPVVTAIPSFRVLTAEGSMDCGRPATPPIVRACWSMWRVKIRALCASRCMLISLAI
jgi:glycosyltransferase involved in cell wall biosynthesis